MLFQAIFQLSDTLEKMHAHKIVHLDLKPSNVMVSRSNFLLNDFGFSVNLGSNQWNFIKEGDGRFCAPELLNDSYVETNKARIDLLSKADMFSLGLTIFTVMTGQSFLLPYNGPDWFKIRSE